MNLDEFQKQSGDLASKGPGGVERFHWCSQGLRQSAGKIDRLLTNCSFQGESLLDETDAKTVSEELGFVLWYCSVLTDAMDKRLDKIAGNHLQRMKAIIEDREKP